MLSEKNIREKEFHNKLQSNSRGRFENIFYKAIYNSNEDFFNFLKLNSINSDILDYGCGVGSSLEKVIKFKPKKLLELIFQKSLLKKQKKSSKI
jgi:hypothetical protein